MVLQASTRRLCGVAVIVFLAALVLARTNVVTPSPCTYLEPGTFLYWLYGCDEIAGGGGGGAK